MADKPKRKPKAKKPAKRAAKPAPLFCTLLMCDQLLHDSFIGKQAARKETEDERDAREADAILSRELAQAVPFRRSTPSPAAKRPPAKRPAANRKAASRRSR